MKPNKTELMERAIRQIIKILEELLSIVLTPEGDKEE
jgi:hypothetical protein